MDYSTVVFFLHLLVAQTSCGLLRGRVNSTLVNSTLVKMHTEISSALSLLDYPGQLPETCMIPNISELIGEGQQNLTADHLDSFSCQLQKILPDINQELSEKLRDILQLLDDVKEWLHPTPGLTCSLPTLDEDMKRHEYVKCLLLSMKQRLDSATFDSSA